MKRSLISVLLVVSSAFFGACADGEYPRVDEAAPARGGGANADDPFGGAGGDACQPSEEVCDGVDNDCDGVVDGGIAGTGRSCDTGLNGRCASGTTECNGEQIVCVPQESVPEICGNEVDDDCDGDVDEAVMTTGWEVRVTHSTTRSTPLQVLWSGSEYVVLYLEHNEMAVTRVMYMQRVHPDGTLLGPPTRLTLPGGRAMHARMAWNGTDYGLVWQREAGWGYLGGLRFQRVTKDGVVLGDPVVLAGGYYRVPEIVFNGTDYGVTWYDPYTSPSTTKFRRTSLAGERLQLSSLGPSHTQAQLTWTGAEYGVAWDVIDIASETTTGMFARLDATGQAIGEAVVTTPAPQHWAGCCALTELFDVASGGGGYAILRRGLDFRPTFIAISADGVPGQPRQLFDEPGHYPEVVWAGDSYFATFLAPQQLSFARLSVAGEVLDRIRLPAVHHPGLGGGRVAWDGTHLIGAWSDTREDNSQEVFITRYEASCSATPE